MMEDENQPADGGEGENTENTEATVDENLTETESDAVGDVEEFVEDDDDDDEDSEVIG